MKISFSKTLILGAAGGVGGAYINILAKSPIANEVIPYGSTLLLADKEPICAMESLRQRYFIKVISDVYIGDKISLIALINKYAISCVIELADIETYDFLSVCSYFGIPYLGTGYGVWPKVYEDKHNSRAQILIRAREIRSNNNRLPYSQKSSYIIGSGMNPGIVNALVENSIHWLSNKRHVSPDCIIEDISHIIFTEEDTTSVSTQFDNKQFPITWNPIHAYEEFVEPLTGYLDNSKTVWVTSSPYQSSYSVWCMDKLITGMLVPHEEVVTIGEKYPKAQTGFIYKIPRVSKQQLDIINKLSTIEPILLNYCKYKNLKGYDAVGVLLQTHSYGCCWFGFKNFHNEAAIYQTNATLMQVAAGVLAGTAALLDAKPGVLVTEDLDTEAYLKLVEHILGPIIKVDLVGYRFGGLQSRAISSL